MNEQIFLYFNSWSFQNEILDTFFIFITDWLIWWMFFIVVLLVFLKKISLKQFLIILITPVLLWIFGKIIKYFYFSPRPFVELSNVKTLITHGLNDSFPSGHTIVSFALAITTFFFHKKTGILFFVFAILIALSRMVVGVHWPTDILGAILIALFFPLLLYKVLK